MLRLVSNAHIQVRYARAGLEVPHTLPLPMDRQGELEARSDVAP